MKKYFKIHSIVIGAGIGFLSFYFFFIYGEVWWELSFLVAFVAGYIAGSTLDIYAGKVTQADLEKHEAKKASEVIDSFEKNG